MYGFGKMHSKRHGSVPERAEARGAAKDGGRDLT